MRSTAIALVCACFLAVSGACGGSAPSSSASARRAAATAATTTTTAVEADRTVAAAPAPGGAAAPGAAPRPSGAASPAGPTAPPTTKPLTFGVTLANPCVRPGTTQSIQISAPPHSAVGYDAVYADGKGGLSPGHYGGNKGGHTDGNGVWSDTWVVALNAPAGPVRVDSAAAAPDAAVGQRQDYFKVSNATGACG